MKKLSYIIPLLLVLLWLSCKKQNEPHPLITQKPIVHDEEYYANLRAYKKSSHSIFYAWDVVSSGMAPVMNNRWAGIPDSVDIISSGIAGAVVRSPSWNEMRNMQQLKGTRVVMFVYYETVSVFDQLGVTADNIPYEAYAKALADSVNKYGFDGIDLDFEGGSDDPILAPIVIALSKYLGPQSGTGKLLVVDGEPTGAGPDVNKMIDYGVLQAYNTSGPESLQSRYDVEAGHGIPPGKIVVAEWTTQTGIPFPGGGIDFTDPIHGPGIPSFYDSVKQTIPSLLGMAFWNPLEGRKAGCGVLTLDLDYSNTPRFIYAREAIQIMNPAVH